MRRLAFSLWCVICSAACTGQKNYGIDQDYYLYRKDANSLVPSVYYQAGNGWYGQMRYNYEDEQTLSVYGGKTFTMKGGVDWLVTPQVGLLAGRFTGAGVGLQSQLQAGAFWLYTEPQYCVSFGGSQPNFFYNWTEICVQPMDFFYAGLAMQQTKLQGEKLFAEPGLVLGFALKKLELPMYFFKPNGADGYFVVGVHWTLK